MSMMNPLAGPSGPGKYATRTDKLSLGSASYGDDTAALNTAAPKSKTRGSADDVGGRPNSAIPVAPITPLFDAGDPTDTIFDGIDRGDGRGSEALMMRKSVQKTSDILAKMIPYDTTGEISIMYQQALSRGD
jgi:hypothetical protein